MKKHNFGRVVVLMGGDSSEREVSLRSGEAVYQALIAEGVNAHKLDPGILDPWACIEQLKNFDRVFLALHGRGGESGSWQGLLDCLKLPYTGSKVRASAIAMDKLMTKRVWLSSGLPTPEYKEVTQKTQASELISALGLPLIIKPADGGSSLGMSKIMDASELESACVSAMQWGGSVIAERWIQGSEYTVAILDQQPLPAIQLKTPRDFYDYQAKYQETTTQYQCPCGLPSEDERALQQLCLQAFNSVGCEGWGRVDVMRDQQGKFWLLEVNTIPGMTNRSLVPMAAEQTGLCFNDLVLKILATTLVDAVN